MSKDIYPQVQLIYGNGVILLILFERYAGRSVTDPILEIINSDGQGWVGTWTTLSVKLQYPRYLHVVWVKTYIKIKIVYIQVIGSRNQGLFMHIRICMIYIICCNSN